MVLKDLRHLPGLNSKFGSSEGYVSPILGIWANNYLASAIMTGTYSTKTPYIEDANILGSRLVFK